MTRQIQELILIGATQNDRRRFNLRGRISARLGLECFPPVDEDKSREEITVFDSEMMKESEEKEGVESVWENERVASCVPTA